MNIRVILFSGILTALAGAMIATAASKLGQPDFNRNRYESESYAMFYEVGYPLIGAALGFLVGSGQECVRELQKQREKELAERDPFKL